MFMVALLSLKVRHPKRSKKESLIFFKDFIVHHYLECVISWCADREAAFSFCHLGYSSACAIFKCRLLILDKLRPRITFVNC